MFEDAFGPRKRRGRARSAAIKQVDISAPPRSSFRILGDYRPTPRADD
jgi:hypothetical protein